MAKAKTKPKKKTASTKRGSPEAIAKRKAARRLNSILDPAKRKQLDGRTENRRNRLIKELKEGKGGKQLNPTEAVVRVNELLTMGETWSSIKKRGVSARKVPNDEDVQGAIEEAQAAYNFAPEAWLILGVKLDAKKSKK